MTVKITAEEMRFIALFEGLTGASARDCIVTQDGRTIAFVVRQGDMGRAIGKNGGAIRKMERLTGKNVEVFEASPEPTIFLRNLLFPAKMVAAEIKDTERGKVAVAQVEAEDKMKAIGKRGHRILLAKKLMERHFGISDVILK
ncbi:MAG: NusA-like transcription termination signal-binding factor [Candidatus Hadarchaeales archaeon]